MSDFRKGPFKKPAPTGRVPGWLKAHLRKVIFRKSTKKKEGNLWKRTFWKGTIELRMPTRPGAFGPERILRFWEVFGGG